METLGAVLQGVLVVVLLVVGGLGLAQRAGLAAKPGRWASLAIGFAASSLVLGVLAAGASRLWPAGGCQLVAWGWALGCALWLVGWGWKAVAAFVRSASGAERWALGGAGMCLLFWLSVSPLSPYPGQITMDLGDPPAYYCAARAMAAGEPGSGYFCAEYPDGSPSYLDTSFLPVAVLAVLRVVSLGAGWHHSLAAYCAVAALLACGVLAELAVGKARGRERLWAWLALAFALLPAHFVLAGLGCATLLGTMGFAACVGVFLASEVGGWRLALVSGTLAAFMVLSRPEAALLVAALCLVAVARGLVWLWGRKPQLAAPLSVLAVGLVCVVFWWKLPAVVSAVARHAPSLSFLHLGYDEASGRFKALHEPPWELNRSYCRQNLNRGAPATEPCNPDVGQEIRAHPFAFVAWLLGRCGQTALYFVRAISVAQWEFRFLAGVPAIAIAVGLMLVATLSRGALPFVAAAALVALALPAVNWMSHVRHLLLVSPVVLALCVRSVLARWGDRLESLGRRRRGPILAAAVFLPLAFLDCRSIIRLRTYRPNRCYDHLLADTERVAAPGDLVAATYPQLVACATGRRCVGGTWLAENLDGVVANWRPAVVAIDGFNGVARNYQQFLQRGPELEGYRPVVHNRAERYIIFRRKD